MTQPLLELQLSQPPPEKKQLAKQELHELG